MRNRGDLLVVVCVAGALAAGEARGAKPGEGLKLGDLEMRPFLTLGWSYDDNVFRSSPGEEIEVGRPPPEGAPVAEPSAGDGASPTEPVISAPSLELGQATEVEEGVIVGEQSDSRIDLRAGVAATYPFRDSGRLTLGADYSGYRYDEYSTEDNDRYGVRAGLGYTTGKGASILAEGGMSYNSGTESRTTSERLQSTNLFARASFRRPLGPKTDLALLGDFDRTDYVQILPATADEEAAAGDAGSAGSAAEEGQAEEIVPEVRTGLDRLDETELGARLYYNAFPKTSFLLDYVHGWVVRDAARETTFQGDAEYDEISLGVDGELATKISGEVTLGYQRRTYDQNVPELDPEEEEAALRAAEALAEYLNEYGISYEEAVPDDEVTEVVWTLGLRYRPTERTTIALTGRQGIDESVFSARNRYLRTGLALSAVHRFLWKVSVGLRAGYDRLEYAEPYLVFDEPPEGEEGRGTPRVIDRTDDQIRLGARITYDLAQWMQFGVAYDFYENDSNLPETSYDNTITSVFVTGRY